MIYKSLIGKHPSALEGVSPVQCWILTDFTSVLLEVGDKRTDPQTSSKTPENTRHNIDEGQSVSANMPDTISTSSSEMQSEKKLLRKRMKLKYSLRILVSMLNLQCMHGLRFVKTTW